MAAAGNSGFSIHDRRYAEAARAYTPEGSAPSASPPLPVSLRVQAAFIQRVGPNRPSPSPGSGEIGRISFAAVACARRVPPPLIRPATAPPRQLEERRPRTSSDTPSDVQIMRIHQDEASRSSSPRPAVEDKEPPEEWQSVKGRRSGRVSSSRSGSSELLPAGVELIHPRLIRGSQLTISCCTADEQSTVLDLADSLAREGWGRGCRPIVVVRMPDGQLTSLDNRRLFAAKMAAERNPELVIPAEVHNWDELARDYTLGDCLIPGIGGEDAATVEDISSLLDKFAQTIPGYQRISLETASYADRVFARMFSKKTMGVLFNDKKHICGYSQNPRVVPLLGQRRHVRHMAELAVREIDRRSLALIVEKEREIERPTSASHRKRERKKTRASAPTIRVPAVEPAGQAARAPVAPRAEGDSRDFIVKGKGFQLVPMKQKRET